MASDDPYHRRNQSSPHSIPLQDLNRPSAPQEEEHGGAANRRRSLSERGRNLFRQRESITGRPHRSSRYEPIAEASPSPTRSTARTRLDTSVPAGHNDPQHGGDYSPIEDPSAFAAAMGFMGFAGLSFQGESSHAQTPHDAVPRSEIYRPNYENSFSQGQVASYSQSDMNPYPSNDSTPYGHGTLTPMGSDNYLPSTENDPGYFSHDPYPDTAPLTNSQSVQSVGETHTSSPNGQRHDRSSFVSVRFTDGTSPGARLGDDLHQAEAGLSPSSRLSRSGSRNRSLSPSTAESPLHRAGTIVRNMSMRVVNISNEPELVERSLRRKSSVRHSRMEGPPSLPAMTAYAHDGAASPPPEKIQSAIPKATSARSRRPDVNPLRGNSLGLFPPDSTLRMKLCDVLVHPITEPLILFLIVVQTILLAVDSRRSVFDDPRSNRWGTSWIDYALVVLFVIYTIEIIIRMIVSGFIINPVEYSTINRQIGLRQAVMDKARDLFTPQRAGSTKHQSSSIGLQQSIFRSFTSHPAGPDLTGDPRQQQRARIAHRAYLRHSFNRLDFLAVVSFWISFGLGMAGIESSKHQYVFRMLSCLRILRLLLITSGTTVGFVCYLTENNHTNSQRLFSRVLKKRLHCLSMLPF
jgi:voltage-dependent calcium channel